MVRTFKLIPLYTHRVGGLKMTYMGRAELSWE